MFNDHEIVVSIVVSIIVSYRRNPNLHNHLVRTKPKENAKAGFSIRCTLEKTKKRGRPCKLCTHMGQKMK